MTLPNFLIIGAGRSGTTSIYHYLREHPQVFMSNLKETNFLAYEGERDADPYLFPIRSLDAYEALFAAGARHRAVGEASPMYLVRPSAIDRIEQLIPHARLIAILRDPAERAHAAYLGASRKGLEPRSLAQALRDYRNGVAGPLPLAHFDSGFYHRHLTRYLDRLDRERLAVHLYDDFARDAGAIMTQIYRFLDVDDSFVPDTTVRYNASGIARNRLVDAVVRTNSFKRSLKSRLPHRLRRPLMALGTAINRRNLVKPGLAQELRRDLIALYREDVLKLQDLLQRDLTAWLTE